MKPKTTNKQKAPLAIWIGFILLLSYSLSWSQDNDCLKCHKETVSKPHIHGPTATSCSACHETTGAEHPKEGVAGFTLFDQGAALCYSCHTELPEEHKLRYKHKPLKEGKCLGCHEPHSSESPKLLVAESTTDLCFSCHKDYKKNIETAKTVHTASIENEKACLKCHNPHASKTKRLLLDTSRNLCLSCHNSVQEKGDRKLANIEKLLNESSHNHPALKKSCTGCHDPHYAERELLVKEAYPLSNYAQGQQENYALCFNCHDTDLLNAKTTATATGFRDGDRNLHYVHVNKDKGRTCMNCHNVHAANNTRLIAETIRFGRWDMPLNYLEKENGGTCATGCHKERSYSRTKTNEE